MESASVLPHADPQRSAFRVLLLALACGIFFLVQSGAVRYTVGDSRLTLLSAQALLEHGSLNLNPYLKDADVQAVVGQGWMLHTYQNAPYNFYPPGPSLVALPFVALARVFGMNMIFGEDDARLQILLAGLSLALLFLMLCRLARLWLERPAATALSLLMILGTTWISTGGTAFWTHNAFALAAVAALYQLARFSVKAEPPQAWALAGALVLAYACRPTGALVLVVSVGWMAWQDFRYLRRLLQWLAIWMGVFILFNFLTIGQALPDYYQPSRWKGTEDYWGGWLGQLLSPSRGLFIYETFLLAGLLAPLIPSLRRDPLVWLSMGWFLILLFVIPRNRDWQGGWCYGPRLLTDALPALALLLFRAVAAWPSWEIPAWLRQPLNGIWAFTALVALWMHSVQGLFSMHTVEWHNFIDSEHRPAAWWEWEYPQFLATHDRNGRVSRLIALERERDHLDSLTPPGAPLYIPGNSMEHVAFEARTRAAWGSKRPFYRSFQDMKEDGIRTFYAPLSEIWNFNNPEFTRIRTWPRKPSLGQWLETHAALAGTVLLVAQDEASLRLDSTTKNWFARRGGHLQELGYQDSWLAVIARDSVLREQTGHGQATQLALGDIFLASAGKNQGDSSSIRYKGIQYSPRHRGINVVVLNTAGEVIQVTWFDTFVSDAEGEVILEVEILK